MSPGNHISNLPGQFIFAKTDEVVPDGWFVEKIGNWHLGRHPAMPRIHLVGDDGNPVGWILGYPIDGNGLLLSNGDSLRGSWFADGSGAMAERILYGFGGRFLAAFVDSPKNRIYLDPCGSLSAVYCVHKEIIASTPNLIPYDDRTGDDVDLMRQLGIPDRNSMYPLELTPRSNVKRLLPNHYLDLSEWRAHRHWPKEPLHHEGDVGGAIDAVTAITKRNIAAIVYRFPTYLRLTAGTDSRMLLACARDVADRIELLTVRIHDEGAFNDVAVARQIGKKLRLRHLVPEYQEAEQKDLDEWMFRIGYSTGEIRGWRAATMFKRANPAYAQLDGAIGALERGAWFEKKDRKPSRITPERLHSYLGAPSSETTLAPIREWLESVPAGDSWNILNLFYLEQRMGCWGGVLPYAEGGNPGPIVFPMCHREVIERMLTLPIPYVLSGFISDHQSDTGTTPFMKEIIEREWPELLEWPFNRPSLSTKYKFAARQVWRKLELSVAL